jgi:hypothetical protein
LKARGQDRRRQDYEGDLEWVVAQPSQWPIDDPDHRQDLNQERCPCQPVERDGHAVELATDARLVDDDCGDRQQRRDQHRRLQPSFETPGVVIHRRPIRRRRPGSG